jgi:hypothetical protein
MLCDNNIILSKGDIIDNSSWAKLENSSTDRKTLFNNKEISISLPRFENIKVS